MSLWLLRHHRLTTWRLGRQMFGFSGDLPVARGLVVGEAPGPNTDSRTPLFPHPPNSAAGRMLQYAEMTHEQYLGRLERVNQCTSEWDETDAKIRHRQIVSWLLENRVDGRSLRVLLLGKRVRKVWGIQTSIYGFGYFRWADIQIAYAPHPSGLNLGYNIEENKTRLGRYLRWTAGLPVSSHSSADRASAF